MPLYKKFINNTTPELDYVKVVSLLKDYANPRDQITKLLKSGELIRVKKGLYVLGPDFQRPYAREVLANLVYGPSYISGVSALSFYQMIPERTETVTSRTPNRNKVFATPVGRFTYEYLPLKQYIPSVRLISLDVQRSFLIATPEKAIAELITKVDAIQSQGDLEYWFESMRIDRSELRKFRLSELDSLRKVFSHPQMSFLIEITRKVKNE